MGDARMESPAPNLHRANAGRHTTVASCGELDDSGDGGAAGAREKDYFDALDIELERRILRQLSHEVRVKTGFPRLTPQPILVLWCTQITMRLLIPMPAVPCRSVDRISVIWPRRVTGKGAGVGPKEVASAPHSSELCQPRPHAALFFATHFHGSNRANP